MCLRVQNPPPRPNPRPRARCRARRRSFTPLLAARRPPPPVLATPGSSRAGRSRQQEVGAAEAFARPPSRGGGVDPNAPGRDVAVVAVLRPCLWTISTRQEVTMCRAGRIATRVQLRREREDSVQQPSGTSRRRCRKVGSESFVLGSLIKEDRKGIVGQHALGAENTHAPAIERRAHDAQFGCPDRSPTRSIAGAACFDDFCRRIRA